MRHPSDLGLPKRFSKWRKGQDRAVKDLLYSDSRHNMLVIPVGGGKSVTYMSVGMVDDGRLAAITATRNLQDQLSADFHKIGLVDMRGRSNYVCNIDDRYSAAEADCTAGVYCPLMKQGGCDYYDQRREAGDSRLVVTNYKYWLHDEESGGLGMFRTLILDEAHRAPDEISEFAAVSVRRDELDAFRVSWPKNERKPGPWALGAVNRIGRELAGNSNRERGRKGRDLMRRLNRLCKLHAEDWVYSRPHKDIWRWDLINPGAVAEQLLFRQASRIVYSSATVRRKTLQLLGVRDDIKIIEQGSTFPVKRRPIYYWPVAKAGRKQTAADWQKIVDAMDEVLIEREDRRAIVHSVSYDRARDIWKASRLKDRGSLIVHRRGQPLDEVLEIYTTKRPPAVLISPALSTGIDLPYEMCEVQIIPKMPFPVMTDPLVRARSKRDKDYIPYVTMQTLVQSTGRGMRAEDDQCETVILDGQFGWMRYAYKDFAPSYFHAAIRTLKPSESFPDPPRALSR